ATSISPRGRRPRGARRPGGATVARRIRVLPLAVLAALVCLGLGATAGFAQQAAPAPGSAAPAAVPADAAPAAAAPAPKVDTGDTAWVLTSSALVLMMTAPGLALFYGGMVRRKNV